ncbi:MAG: hypothetical protein LJE68_12050 [Rhodobacter sp.]|jgi:hypothetical protein|nr:hypothetical protein [Rhodobacter sp.]
MSTITCPSATCEPGAYLLGTLGSDGRIKHLRTPLRVDADFVAKARANGEPESHMRFAAPCQEGKCSHWTGAACGLIDRVMAHLDALEADIRADSPPPCTIRGSCRWYRQSGVEACLSCDLVVRLPEATAAE